MATRDEAEHLVRRMIECFNSRQFDQADDLYSAGFLTHPFGVTGFAAGKEAWRMLVARYPDLRLVPDDILADGDMVTVRSSIEGSGVVEYGTAPILIEVFRVENGRFAEWWGSTWKPELG